MMKRPWVSVNMAISLDGKISTKSYTPAHFTSEADSRRLLELRAGADALLVGRGTLEADQMRLTVPESILAGRSAPLRCVLSRSGKWNKDHLLYASEGSAILLAHTGECCEHVEGVELLRVGNVVDLLEKLADRGVKHLHCEGGGVLLKSLFAGNAVDELHLTWAAHCLFGGEQAPSITGEIGGCLEESCQFELVHFEPNGQGECFLSYCRVGGIRKPSLG